MFRKMITRSLLLGMLLSMGCAPYWQVTKGHTRRSAHYGFSVPARWMKLQKGEFVLLSRHGPALESMMIIRRDIDKKLSSTSLRFQQGMLPHEIGEVVLNALIASPGVSRVVLLGERVFPIDGYQAVRLETSYSIGDIERRAVTYSLIVADSYYELRFVAAARHYYEESLAAFEELVRSFDIR